MYIKLGSTKLNYRNQGTSDFIILSEIVDSSLSYEKPVLVRTTEELDIWFGENFTSRDYFIELLKRGITLFLYKPVNPKPNTLSPDYISYSDFDTNEILFLNVDDALSWIEPRRPEVSTLSARATRLSKNTNSLYVDLETETLYLPEGRVDEDNELLILGSNDYNSSGEGDSDDINISISLVPKDVYHMLYKIISDGGEYMEDGISYDLAIYQNNELVFLNALPQNLDTTSDSINNRDTLAIFNRNEYLSPLYNSCSTENLFLVNSHSDLNEVIDKIDYNKFSNNYQTLAFKLEFGSNFLSEIDDDTRPFQYLVILSPKDKKQHIIIFRSKDRTEEDIKNTDLYKNIVGNNITPHFLILGKTTKKQFTKILTEELGYVSYLGDVYVSNVPCPVNYYYDVVDFTISPEFNITNDILYSTRSDRNYEIAFVSKTIGTGGESGNINIKIIDLGDEVYRITISRFNYSEIFEGKLVGTVDEQRLDHIITNESKLVICDLGVGIKKLTEGEWYLKGGFEEINSSDYYMKSLHSIFNMPEPIFFDYLLVPDIKKFTKSLDENLDYYSEYETFIRYSKSIGNQVLVQNLDNWKQVIELDSKEPEIKKSNILYKINNDLGNGSNYFALVNNKWTEITDRELIAENTYEFNYTGDKENRIIYFYRSMEVYGNTRPGYYIYLYNLLFDDVYSPSVDYIIYNSPIGKDTYTDTPGNIENSLINKKCNYLVENNQIYYYKKYQNGEKYENTGWMRFCLGKISRELSKNKGLILSDKDVGSIKSKIKEILDNILKSFSIIRDIQLSDFSVSFQNQTIDLTIDTYMSDLVDNDLRIEITLNYYK